MALKITVEEYKMENVAVRTVSPNRAKKSIRHAFKKQRPIFMWGPPGIGSPTLLDKLLNH